MTATKQRIRDWLESGKAQGATHVIVVCDAYDHNDYPVYVMPGEEVREREAHFRLAPMQQVMEVYSLNLDVEAQLAEHRVFHYD